MDRWLRTEVGPLLGSELRHRTVLRKAHDLVIFILGHRDTSRAFQELSLRKRQTEMGAKMWVTLVLDNDTRWDTFLMLVERIVYFDAEILALFQRPELRIPRDCILERDELDLAYAMKLILDPFREFTKFVQYRNRVTLAYVPRRIDALVTKLAPGAFAERLRGRHDLTLPRAEALQARLTSSLKERFAPLFTAGSLALAAAYLLPGPGQLAFAHFVAPPIAEMRENMLADFISLLDPTISDEEKVESRTLVAATLALARRQLDAASPDADPLRWWPLQALLACLLSGADVVRDSGPLSRAGALI